MATTQMPRHCLIDAQCELIADLFPTGSFKTGRFIHRYLRLCAPA
jgi:hypothetical protein